MRVCRVQTGDFERAAPGHLIATEEALEARGTAGRAFGKVKRAVIGAPLSTAQAAHERLTKTKALAVLSSDALSSVAYATEEILHVLLLAGLAALSLSLPIGAGIVALLLIVGISYRQTIKAYPQGGGSYIVAKDNLGELPALTAGAALLFGYIVTVSVSIAAGGRGVGLGGPGVARLPHRARDGVHPAGDMLNLRGIRESGSIFSVPTYLFLVGIVGMIALGIGAGGRQRIRARDARHARRRGRGGDADAEHPAHPDRVQPRLRRPDRRRGDLGWGARLPAAGMEECAVDADLDDRHPGHHLLRHHLPRQPVRHRAA